MKKSTVFLFVLLSALFFSQSPLFGQACGCDEVPQLILTGASSNNVFQQNGAARLQLLSASNTTVSRSFVSLFGEDVANPARAGEMGFFGSYIRFQVNKTNGTFGSEAMRITANGRVGIGTTNPLSTLAVNGGIESEEVQVKADVADYVFKDDYDLLPLEEVEAYIEANGYLPNIQNEKSVEENRGHVKLGELSISLMEKVEELTLHLIEMNKRVKKLEEENEMLKAQVKEKK